MQRKLLLATLSGVLYFLSWIGFGIWPLAFVCFLPLLWALRETTPRQALKLAQEGGVLVRAADIEGVVAVHPSVGAGQLVGQGLGVGGGRLGVGHLEHRHDTAPHRCARSGLQVFLPFQAGFTEVHLGVDDAWHDGQALGVECLA